jgi:PRTRC genetic system protein B
MTSHVRIGDNRIFTLKQAVLLYQDGSTTFATLHEVKSLQEGAPYLGAGQSVTTGFLEGLAKGLGASLAAEVLPETVLARTPDLITWWSPEKCRLMFFGDSNQDTRKLNGRRYPHPALVFMVNGRELFVRALGENRRPTTDTRLRTAPYWNTDAHGRVCLGSMRVPEKVGACSLSGWEDAYFASEFTHPSGAIHLTTHPGGFLGLWSGLAGRDRRFPVKLLADAKQTLQEFVQKRGEP